MGFSTASFYLRERQRPGGFIYAAAASSPGPKLTDKVTPAAPPGLRVAVIFGRGCCDFWRGMTSGHVGRFAMPPKILTRIND
jgi:hypothetical protein